MRKAERFSSSGRNKECGALRRCRGMPDSTMLVPVHGDRPQRTYLDWLASWFARLTAENPASAESAGVPPADAKRKAAENTESPLRGEVEQQIVSDGEPR
jgi:hypothetical protein